MKKLLILLILASTITKANKIDSLKLPDSTSITLSKVYSDVKSGIAGLSAGLKVGVEHVYEVLVKQQVVYSITWLFIMIFSFFPLIIFGKSVWKWASENSGESEGFSIFLAVIFYIFTVIPCIVVLFHLDIILTGFINPEYGAIQDIINFVKR